MTPRRVVIIGVFVLVVVTIILMEFTNLGMPKAPPPPPPADHVDGVYLGKPDSHRVKAPGPVNRQVAPPAPSH